MKKALLFFLMAAILMSNAAAANIPDNEVCENRNGRQLIIKTFTLDPGADPDTLIEEPFEREGYSYTFLSIVKEERPFENKKPHNETVTVEIDFVNYSLHEFLNCHATCLRDSKNLLRFSMGGRPPIAWQILRLFQ